MALDEIPPGGAPKDDEQEVGAAPDEPVAPLTEGVPDDDDQLVIDRFDRDADKATDTSADDAP
jgi:hypothetical protein